MRVRLPAIAGSALAVTASVLAVTSASAAVHQPQRTCSQSVRTGGRPGGVSNDYQVWVRTDTCGRWIRSAERCKYPGAFGGASYKWHVGQSVRAIGARSVAVCGVLAESETNWGFQFYIKGSGKGHGWQFKQEGHHSSATLASFSFPRKRNKSDATTEKNGCHYGFHLNPLGAISATGEITWDSCHRDIWTYAKRTQPPPLGEFVATGRYETHYGDFSTAKCPAHDLDVAEAGFRYHYKKCVPNGVGTCTTITVTGQYRMYNG
jgi:hypothetical protein